MRGVGSSSRIWKTPSVLFGPIAGAPPGNKGGSQGGVVEINRDRVVQRAAQTAGAIAQPSAPKFASSHVCI
jgi:hypothetical protein